VQLRFTYIGGPTALIEIAGIRFLTDPTFDDANTEYATGQYTLTKVRGPAVSADDVGRIDAVLLSHDHHFDNLDRRGRDLLSRAGHVLTTETGAARLTGNALGLKPWQSFQIQSADGRAVSVTATPARHGPATGDRGPVIGFLIEEEGEPSLYVSGDTVWYEGAAEVAKRARVGIALLFMGAAKVSVAGPSHLTMTASEAVEAARAFRDAVIVPLHFEDWKHFTETRADIEREFERNRLSSRLFWPRRGTTEVIIAGQ